ncbi:MAG: CHRD domain-containing protein [Dehalococcoidia bacterium]
MKWKMGLVLALALFAALSAVTFAQGGESVTVQLNEQSDSGQSGTAVLTAMGQNQTEVAIVVTPGDPADDPQPAHIHAGRCGPGLGGVVYPLTNVVGGTSVTTVDASLDSLRTGDFAINIHKSVPEIAVFTACGNIPALTYPQLRAMFGNWTNLDAQINGYVRDPACISSGSEEIGDMGFHAVKESLIDEVIQTSQPEVLVLDADGNVVAVEYLSTAEERPVLTNLFPGEETAFEQIPGEGIWALHVWFIPNPNGITADFNPNVVCPEASKVVVGLPPTGDVNLPWGYLALVGGVALLLGFGLLRRAAQKA